MTVLEIEGKKVKVSDDFLNLSPEEQERTVEEIASSMGATKQRYPIMSNVNRGIADTAGGLVDLLNPFDQPLWEGGPSTGSAKTGLTNLMQAGGIEVAQGEPQTLPQSFARGVGDAAAAAVPFAKGAQALSGAGGIVGNIADDAAKALATRAGIGTELLAGGASEVSRKTAADAGAPDWVQQVAAIAGPAAVLPGAIAATKGIARFAPSAVGARQLGRTVSAMVAPYTERGGRQVARERLQSLAGGPERADELARRIEPDNEFGLTPAQQTEDPYMLAVEQTAASQNPVLRERLAERMTQSGAAGRQAVEATGGDVTGAQAFFADRRREFGTELKSRADQAIRNAEQRIASAGPQRGEADNAMIVSGEIDKALKNATAQEAALWGKVPRGATVGTGSAKAAAQSEIDSIPHAQRNDIPRVVRELVEEGSNVYGADATVNDMHGLYSELRRVARSAMAGNDQNKNMARIANKVADAILDDLGAVDASTAIGRSINEARAYSAALHETFDRGAVGRLLKRTIDGDTSIDPELALSRTVGRGGVAGDVAARQIERASDVDQTRPAIVDYLRDGFSKAVVTSTGEFNSRSARTFMRDNADLLKRYPELREEVLVSVTQRENADAFAKRIGDRIAAINSKKTSTATEFLGAAPDKAIRSILDAQSPARAARILANEARKDNTGAAMAGLKGAFSGHLVNVGPGDAMVKALADPKMAAAMRQVFSAAEIGRLRYIARNMAKLETASRAAPSIGENLSGAKPNTIIEMMARIVAARHGAQLGGGSGGSIQTAQMASSRMKKILGNLATDKASQILADAVEDPELFRALLSETASVRLDEKVLPKIIPYLAGTAAANVE